jgi:hypothetical protein
MEASKAKHREGVGWELLEQATIGLANKVLEKATEAAENGEPEKCLEWINAIHGAVALVERMNHDDRSMGGIRALDLSALFGGGGEPERDEKGDDD